MKELLVSIVIILACIFFYVLTIGIPTIAGFERMTPSFWPRFNLIGIVILSAVIILRSLLKPKEKEPAAKKDRAKGGMRGLLICAGILFLFILLMPYLGFLITAFLSTSALMFALGERKKRTIFLSSFILVALIYLVFGKLMYVPMPRGVSIIQEISYYLY
ncbi:MAG: tripartite tricarboxylate transporter TctB family protein [Desulfobacterales bacterium]|nr:tripartite tricarboxylate transporter TctB family protein [Desulfobacterales bacterium]